MDLSIITDIDKLKSLAYDEIKTLEQTQSNLKVINSRIAQLEQEAVKKPVAEVTE